MKQKLQLPIIFLIIGFAAGFFAQPKPEMKTEVVVQEKVIKTKASAHHLKEAKQLYQRAFLLFLGSIGIRLEQKQFIQFEEVMDNPKLAENLQPTTIKPPTKGKGLEVHLGAGPTTADNGEVIAYQRKMNHDSIDKKTLFTTAKKFILKDPAVFLAKSKFIKKWNKAMDTVNGSFIGVLHRIDGKNNGRIEEIEINVNFVVNSEGKIDGDFFSQISRDGEPYSTSRGTGGNNDIRVNPENPDSVIIEASPNSFYHAQLKDFFVLNYYEDGVLIGIAHLTEQ